MNDHERDPSAAKPAHAEPQTMTERKLQVLHPAGWVPSRGYANGVAARGRMVFIGGQIGWDSQQHLVAGDFVAQARQALANVVAVLAEAGGRAEHIARMTWYVVDRGEYLASQRALGAAYREIVGRHFPAMTAIEVSALIEDGARVEIEATAVIPDEETGPASVAAQRSL